MESVYRNSLNDVKKFLEFWHKDNYKLYNLCCEKNKQYSSELFGGWAEQFGFRDHCSPPFILVVQFCKDIVLILSYLKRINT